MKFGTSEGENIDDVGQPDNQLAEWSCLVAALPFCAAVIAADGEVLLSNRPDEVLVGDKLANNTDTLSTTQARTNEYEWRLRPIDAAGSFRLAVAESNRNEDDLMSKFFSLGNPLFVVYDTFGKIVQANEAWENLLGYSKETLFSLDSWDLLPPEDLLTREEVENDLRTNGRSEPTYKMRTVTGEYRTIRWSLEFDPKLNRCFGVGRDITNELKRHNELMRRAYSDDLTGLANRAALMEELHKWLGGPFTPAVLFCDLDKFKEVNDSLGHRAGDELLQALGDRLGQVSLGPDSLVARLGGDEFVILLGAGTGERAETTAQQILSILADPFEVHGTKIELELSVGIAVAEDDACDAETLLERADFAAYEAKRQAGLEYVVFDVANAEQFPEAA